MLRNLRHLGHELLEDRQLLHGDATSASNFAPLNDVNPTSPTYGQPVSLGDFTGSGTTAWYFIHST